MNECGEDLHVDLRPCVSTRLQQSFISHPLIHSFYDPASVHVYNELYRQKTARLELAVAEKDVITFLNLHEKPFRFDAMRRAGKLGLLDTPEWYWRAVAHVWTRVENIYEQLDAWTDTWTADVPNRHLAMSEAEQKRLRGLPEAFTIFRGCRAEDEHDGLSWTLSEDVATWFARRAPGSKCPLVMTATVRRDDVMAYFAREDEIVVLFGALDEIRYQNVMRTPML